MNDLHITLLLVVAHLIMIPIILNEFKFMDEVFDGWENKHKNKNAGNHCNRCGGYRHIL